MGCHHARTTGTGHWKFVLRSGDRLHAGVPWKSAHVIRDTRAYVVEQQLRGGIGCPKNHDACRDVRAASQHANRRGATGLRRIERHVRERITTSRAAYRARWDLGVRLIHAGMTSVVYKPSDALRTLLTDRSKLAMHTETKELTVYALVVVKDGPKMEKAPGPGGTGAGGGMIKGTMEMSTFVSYRSSQVGRRGCAI